MSPEQQRIAIAQACGWRGVDPRRWGGYTDTYNPLCSMADAIGAPAKFWGYVPDYLNDLNAMHEAEKVLTEKRVRSYAFTLAQVLDTSPTVDLDDQFLNIHATAAQRAEAFGLTLKLWKP